MLDMFVFASRLFNDRKTAYQHSILTILFKYKKIIFLPLIYLFLYKKGNYSYYKSSFYYSYCEILKSHINNLFAEDKLQQRTM